MSGEVKTNCFQITLTYGKFALVSKCLPSEDCAATNVRGAQPVVFLSLPLSLVDNLLYWIRSVLEPFCINPSLRAK